MEAKELKPENVEVPTADLFNGRMTLPFSNRYELILPEFSKMTAYTRTAILTALIEARARRR